MSLPQRVPRKRRTGQSIQAAARLMPSDEKRFAGAEPSTQGGFTWQTRAWHVVKHLGLIHYGMDFIKDNAAQLEFFVAQLSDDPEIEDERLDADHPASVELERLGRGPYGGVSDLIAQLVVHEEAAGEGYLSVRYERDGEPVAAPQVSLENRFAEAPEDFEEVWEVLTPQTKKRRENDPKLKPVQSVRVWKPDPERPEFPDSSLRSVLPECEQLLLIQQHVTGTLQSRLHSGILVVPEELDPTPPGPPDDGDDEMSPLMRDMLKVFTSPIADPNAAAAVMPYLLMGKGDLLEHVRHIDLSREFDEQLLEWANHLKVTIAGGMDLPAERLLGMGNSNHWNVWYLDESTYVQHLEPDIDLVVGGLLRAWLRPAWRAAGLDPEAFTVVADPSKLTMMSAVGMPGDLSIDELQKRAETAGTLVRAGYDAEAILEVVGLPEIPHTGFLPVTISERTTEGEVVVDTVEVAPVTAAATPDDLGRTLADIDARVLSDLLALAEVEVETQTEAAEDRLLEAMALAGISTDTEPLAQALADANIDAAAIVPVDAFDAITELADGIMAMGLADAADAVGVEPGGIAGSVAGAGAALSLALTDWLRSRWFSETPAADANAARFARNGVVPQVPPGLIRDVMTAAGGGQGATPGSIGLANGATVESWLLQLGLATIRWQWRYGAAARETFRPHRALDGTLFDMWESDELYNSSNRWPHNNYWYPNDHRGCSCAAVRVLAPAAEVVTV